MAQEYVENVTSFATCLSSICRQHKEEVPGDIFDMLLTFTDFVAFKEMFLEYRAVSYCEPLNQISLRISTERFFCRYFLVDILTVGAIIVNWCLCDFVPCCSNLDFCGLTGQSG